MEAKLLIHSLECKRLFFSIVSMAFFFFPI